MSYLDKLKSVQGSDSPEARSGYLSKLQPVSPEAGAPQEGFLKTMIKGLVRPVTTMLARPIQAAATVAGASPESIDVATQKIAGDYVAPVPRSGSDVIKDVGRAVQTVSLGVGGAVPTVGKGFLGTSATGRAIQALSRPIATAPGAIPVAQRSIGKAPLSSIVKEGVGIGAKGGAMFGAGTAMEETGDLSRVPESLLAGGALGVAGGAAFPLAIRAASKPFQAVSAKLGRKAEDAALLKSGSSDSRVAGKMLEDGKVVKDPLAKEVIRQGIPEADVALMKTGTPRDKSKMLKMLDIREKQLTDKYFAATNRASDVAGESAVKGIVKPLEELKSKASQKLDIVAKSLAGKRADFSAPVNKFAEELNNMGITLKRGSVLNFDDSAFAGRSMKAVRSDINDVWSRILKLAKTGDAYQGHKIKTFIDQIVEYGAEGAGLKGKASVLLKQLRHNIDSILDTNFRSYNRVNSQFADTIGALNKLRESVGQKTFRLTDEFLDMGMGTKLRSLFSNTVTRAQLMSNLKFAQEILQKYGVSIDDDIIRQSAFVDTLEKMLGPEAQTSLAGEFAKGLESFGSSSQFGGAQQIGSAVGEIARGNLIRGTIKAGGTVIDALRGINTENKIKALRALLGAEKPKTVFGNPIKKTLRDRHSAQ